MLQGRGDRHTVKLRGNARRASPFILQININYSVRAQDLLAQAMTEWNVELGMC